MLSGGRLLQKLPTRLFFLGFFLRFLLGWRRRGFSSLKRAFSASSAAQLEPADEIEHDIQLPALQGKARLRSAQSRAAMLLREAGMSAGIEGGEPEAVGGQAGERKLLSRGGKYRAGPAVAEGASGLLAAEEVREARCVTRSLHRARGCDQGGCGFEGSRCVTRSLSQSTRSAGGDYLDDDRAWVTRGHRSECPFVFDSGRGHPAHGAPGSAEPER